MICAQREGKSIPLAAAALGSRLVAVNPGMVLSSRMYKSPVVESLKLPRMMKDQLPLVLHSLSK